MSSCEIDRKIAHLIQRAAAAAGGDLPEVHDVDQLLHYQEQSIVSRMLVKNAGGSVTLFAFDSGEGLSEHTVPFDALVIGVDGKVDVTIDGKPYSVGTGQSLLLPAGHPHAVAPVARFKMLLVMIGGKVDASQTGQPALVGSGAQPISSLAP